MRSSFLTALLAALLLAPWCASAQGTDSEPAPMDDLAKRYLSAVLAYNPYDLPSTYELACCFGAQGDAAQAALYLGKAIELGFDDLWSIDRNSDFEPVRVEPEFVAIVDQLAGLLAEREANYGELNYIDTTVRLPYRLQLPEGYDGSAAVPLVVGLHGFGGNADWFGTLWHTFDHPGFIYTTLQAPYGVPNAGEVGYSWTILRHGAEETGAETLDLSTQLVLDFITSMYSQYNISEVYLLGFSQGGILAYNVALSNPAPISGIACFASRLEGPSISPGRLAVVAGSFRLFIAHGSRDEAVPIAQGRAAYEVFEAAGYDTTWLEYDNVHTLPADALREFQRWVEGSGG